MEEARATRAQTLKLVDLLLTAPAEVRVWTLGKEVEPGVYLLALRERLADLAGRVRKARPEAAS